MDAEWIDSGRNRLLRGHDDLTYAAFDVDDKGVISGSYYPTCMFNRYYTFARTTKREAAEAMLKQIEKNIKQLQGLAAEIKKEGE